MTEGSTDKKNMERTIKNLEGDGCRLHGEFI